MCNLKNKHQKKYYRDIIFLGAGASKGIGLPLMKGLLKKMEMFYSNKDQNQYRKKFNNFKDLYMKYCSDFKKDPSQIYLEDFFTLIENEIETKIREKLKYASYYNIDYENFKKEFAYLLSYYLCWKAYFYRCPFEKRYIYFKNIIDSSYTFITTNWDLMIESEMVRSEKYFDLNTIYGISIEHDINSNKMRSILEKEFGDKYTDKINKSETNQPKDSDNEVSLLKLHGSSGWLQFENRAGLSGYYVGALGYGESFNTPLIEPEPLIIYPSYKKKFDSIFLKKIFNLAKAKIEQSKSIDIIGYSLRDEDEEVKKLLGLLQFGDRDIRVISNNPNDKEKWDDLLHKDKYKFICDTAENFYSKI